jgi:HPt (histidine-containing phosphotransfer) domain-containing protein
MRSDSALDEDMMTELAGLGDDFLSNILEIYRRDATEHVQAIRQAARQGDHQSWQRRAHALKGSSGAIGARAMMLAAFALEECDGTNLDPVLAQLGEAFDEVRTEIDRRLADDDVPPPRSSRRGPDQPRRQSR